jgi:hypothetical protein
MINRTTLLNSASALVLLAGASFYVQPAMALTITFDDLTDTSAGFGGTMIPNGYQGLNWTNWYVLNTPAFTVNANGGLPNGALNGTVSLPNVAYNLNGDLAIFSNNPFTFNSADLTAFWRNGLQVTVTGLLGGVVQDTITLSLLATGPTFENFNWSNINEVDVLPIAGTGTKIYNGDGTQVAMDNLTITQVVPAPLIGHGLPVVLAVGGLLLGAKLSERSKKRPSLGSAIPREAA